MPAPASRRFGRRPASHNAIDSRAVFVFNHAMSDESTALREELAVLRTEFKELRLEHRKLLRMLKAPPALWSPPLREPLATRLNWPPLAHLQGHQWTHS